LDDVRVPQKYPGKRHYKGDKKGKLSGNPLGKNPGDVWDIPNVKAKHVEKTEHPCQFPVAVPARLILALTNPGALVVDPYMGSGSTGVAAIANGRRFAGSDITRKYLTIARKRVGNAVQQKALIRADMPPRQPKATDSVSKLSRQWKSLRRKTYGSDV